MVAIAHVSSSADMLQKLYEEIDNSPVEKHTDLKNLPYLDSIYREVLRFASPTAVVPRCASLQSTMKVQNRNKEETNCTIYPNSWLFFAVRPIHHDPELWENPEIFNPDRFKKAAENNENHYMGDNYFPFSGGRRGCPAGNGFVEYVFKGFLMEFFKNFQIKLDKPLECIDAAAIHPRWKNEYSATLEKHNLYTPIMMPMPGL